MMPTDYIPLNSTNLNAAQYDEENRTLRVLFVNGQEYEYDDVPEEIAKDLFTAPSAGMFFNSYIKNRYRFFRI